MTDLHFDIRDILKAPKLAWSWRKISVSFRGILVAWLIYIIGTYISLFLTEAGRSVGVIPLFRYFEFFPVLLTEFRGTWQYVLYGLTIMVALFYLLATATAVSRIAFEDIRGNDVFQVREALQFAHKYGSTAIVSVVVLGALFLVFPVTLLIWGAVGRIPFVGELIFAISSIPVIVWGMLGIAVKLVFLFGLILIPSITACLCEDVLETVIQTFTSVFLQPCRLLMYEITAKVITVVSALIFALFSFFSVIGTNMTCGLLFGNSIHDIFTIALYRVPGALDLAMCIIAFFDQLNFVYPMISITDISGVSMAVHSAGVILGLSYLMIAVLVLSYAFSCFFSAQVLIYLAVRKRKEGDDLRLRRSSTDFVPEVPAES